MSAEKARKRLRFMMVFMPIAYAPLLAVVGMRHDIVETSLSGIGWREGGLVFLIIWVVYTIPLMIYQVIVFMKLNNVESKKLLYLSFVSSAMIAIGALFPVSETAPQFSHLLHSILCQIGSVLAIVIVTTMVTLYCKDNKQSVKKVAISYAVLLASILIGFAMIFTAALFEIVGSIMLLIAMYLLNLASFKNLNKEENKKLCMQ